MLDISEALLNLMKKRRSIRSFSSKAQEINEETLRKLLDAARWTPTPGNAQSCRFVVVRNKQQITNLLDFSPGLFSQPTVIVAILSDTNILRQRDIPDSVIPVLAAQEAAMAAQNLMLLAEAEGLGSCVIGSFSKTAVRELINCPRGIIPILLLAIGYPSSTPPTPPRRLLSEVAFYEIYGGRRFQ